MRRLVVAGLCAMAVLPLAACSSSGAGQAGPTPSPSVSSASPSPSTSAAAVTTPAAGITTPPTVAPTPDATRTGKPTRTFYKHAFLRAQLAGAVNGILKQDGTQCRVAHFDNAGNVVSASMSAIMPDGSKTAFIIGAGSTGPSTFVSGATGVVLYANSHSLTTGGKGGGGTADIGDGGRRGAFQGTLVDSDTGATTTIVGSYRCS